MNNPVHLGFSILEISKTMMYEFCYDYTKPKYQDNPKLCYMDIDSSIIYIKTEDFNEDIADDVQKIFDASNYEADRPLPKRMNREVTGLMKDELGGKIMIVFGALRPRTYSHLMDDDNKHKKLKEQRNAW